VVQVVPLSLSARPCGLIICRAFFRGVDDFVDEFVLLDNQIFSGLVHWEAGRLAVFIYQYKPIL
jgi:hypothetical protein